MRSSAAKIQMTGFDDLFRTGCGASDSTERVQEIPLSELFPFKNHPFQVRDDEAMRETADSIAKYGVLVPGIARPRSEGGYEIVAGHRRKWGCELAGKETMPVIVREMDNDEVIIMVDSNLQREKILPSEKAFAYKMKLDVMRRQAGRSGKNNSATALQNYGGRTSREILAEQSGESHEQIRKYIRLTCLIPAILNMVDENKIVLRPAVELSYLDENEQRLLFDAMERENCTPSHAQTVKMRKLSQDGKLTAAAIMAILSEKPVSPIQITFKKDRFRKWSEKSAFIAAVITATHWTQNRIFAAGVWTTNREIMSELLKSMV